MNKTFDWSKISKNWFHKIIHKFGSVTTKWLVFQKAPPFIFIWLLKWPCLGHNKMNQAKNPECQAGRVDITVEQCVCLLKILFAQVYPWPWTSLFHLQCILIVIHLKNENILSYDLSIFVTPCFGIFCVLVSWNTSTFQNPFQKLPRCIGL